MGFGGTPFRDPLAAGQPSVTGEDRCVVPAQDFTIQLRRLIERCLDENEVAFAI
jgi:hypothetical protein